MNKRLSFIFATFLVVGLSSPARSAPTREFASNRDSRIFSAIEKNLWADPAVSDHLIDVSVLQGIVTLKGSVDNVLAKDRAEAVAESIKGVRAVVNQIEVRPVNRSNRTLKNDVEMAFLLDPAVDSHEVDVTAKNGVVTLQGQADSWAEKELAGQTAKGVKGVRRVINQIYLDMKSNRSDKDIEAEVDEKLRRDVYLTGSRIDVDVASGIVKLNGKVGNLPSLRHAKYNARVAGVTKVDASGLEVDLKLQKEMTHRKKWAKKDDRFIMESVKDALFIDPRVKPFGIDVQIQNGVVTLKGKVDNLKAKLSAERTARSTRGVAAVSNRIVVAPPDDLDEYEIEKSLETSLKLDPYLERHDLTLAVRNNTAVLYGVVDTRHEKWLAEDIAARTYGVAGIDNKIRVRSQWEEKPDDVIKKDIESELFWSIFVEKDEINVRVDDGVAVLKGQVDSWDELSAAVKNAYDGGAKKVDNRLSIAGYPPHDPYKSFWEYKFRWY